MNVVNNNEQAWKKREINKGTGGNVLAYLEVQYTIQTVKISKHLAQTFLVSNSEL